MQLHTLLCDRLGIRFPIIQAPIGGAASPRLVAAVSGAGGLGMHPISLEDPGAIIGSIRETRALTSAPFGVNLILEWPQEERLKTALDEGVRVVSFFWGDPRPHVETAHAAGALVFHSVGSIEEARRAVDAGVDVVVAQGWEAGGHVRGTVATLPLIPEVADAIAPVPVVAAGGIGDGRGLAAALMLGASAAWMGTRFLASAESVAHREYKKRVLAAGSEDTVYTTLFDVGWPNAPHRVIRNRTVEAWEVNGRPASGTRPGEGDAIAEVAGRAILRYSDMSPQEGTTGAVDALALYAGQSVGLIHEVLPAGEIVEAIVAEATRALSRAHEL